MKTWGSEIIAFLQSWVLRNPENIWSQKPGSVAGVPTMPAAEDIKTYRQQSVMLRGGGAALEIMIWGRSIFAVKVADGRR